MNHPEDVSIVVSKGAVYTATRDGWVKYIILHNETLVNWKHVDSQSLLGLTTTKDGDVIMCDNEKVRNIINSQALIIVRVSVRACARVCYEKLKIIFNMFFFLPQYDRSGFA